MMILLLSYLVTKSYHPRLYNPYYSEHMMRSSRDSEEGGASRGNVKAENADAIAIQRKATQNLAAAAATAVAAVAAVVR